VTYGLFDLGGVSSRVSETGGENWGGDADIEERFDTRAAELDAEPVVLTELAGLSLLWTSFCEDDDFGGRAGPVVVDDDDADACSRAALRFCLPLSTPFLATLVWSLQARSN
jgi:hypothetical protein